MFPCFWQSRIQAGDLSSHIYNAWLVELIERGQLPGLAVARQTTNVVFDWMLSALLHALGAEWAQRLSVSLAVLIFVWGAFAFVSAISRRPAWRWLPCLAMLAYGWVFHMGFLNFYLSLGFCFWALAALSRITWFRLVSALALFALGWVAHALPVGWSFGLIAYSAMARHLRGRGRAALLAVAMVALLIARVAITRLFLYRWSFTQLFSAIGADQVFVFDFKYALLLGALLFVWLAAFGDRLRTRGAHSLIRSVPFHWCALTSAGILILPGTILFPGYNHALAYIGDRMSLALAVCVCALLGRTRLRVVPQYGLALITLVFFLFLFRDERRLNQLEDRVDRAVAEMPAGQRVVAPILDPGLRANPLAHTIDRACLGRCYSYANYEPSTAQFRVRTLQPNPFVTADYGDSWKMQNGEYVFRDRDLPLYLLLVSPSGVVSVRPATAGVVSGPVTFRP
ncbi:MAG TPA: hypothetical protein VGF16_03570 [Bryobacteraceae bacterium]